MALRHEPFEECRCCDKARETLELYQREILAASTTVDAAGKTFVVVPEVKAEIERLEKLVYIPGVWRCAKCEFRLIQSNLNAADGSVTARDTPGDKCPNCASPLWRVTERQERIEALDMVEKQFERQRDWAPLAKALFQTDRDPAIKDQAWFDFQGKAQRLIALMQNQK